MLLTTAQCTLTDRRRAAAPKTEGPRKSGQVGEREEEKDGVPGCNQKILRVGVWGGDDAMNQVRAE